MLHLTHLSRGSRGAWRLAPTSLRAPRPCAQHPLHTQCRPLLFKPTRPFDFRPTPPKCSGPPIWDTVKRELDNFVHDMNTLKMKVQNGSTDFNPVCSARAPRPLPPAIPRSSLLQCFVRRMVFA